MESCSFPAQLSFITDLFSNTRLRQDFATTIVDKLQVWTGCQCVGIRIVNPDSYMPYEAYVGFSQEFWEHENWLSLREHQCGCIRIVNNETLPADQPILTEKGSILSNDLQAFGESLGPADATLYRGKCIECGFGSLALVPIRQQDTVIGLIHLADMRTNLLPPALIQTLEVLTAPIAEVIERFNTENVLGENRKLLSQAQKIAHIGSWKLDIATNHLAWSDEVFRIFGFEPQEFDATYEDFLGFIHPDDRVAVEEAYSRSVREGRDDYEIEHRIVRRTSGEIRYVHEHCVHERDATGVIVQSIGVVQDITERKQAQMALQQKIQELEQFVYSVTHDLKSPLVTVRTFSGMLLEDLQDGDQQQINEDLDYIGKAADKMQQLLDALLEYSRIGRISIPAQTLSASQSVDNCLAALAGILQQHQVQVSTDKLPQRLHGAPLHFEQMWQNLIENAVKYRGNQTHPQIEIGALQQCHDVVFYVRDNGMGIEPEHNERIFNLFSQLNPDSDGSGLGLALVKKIVSIYHGRIWVESSGKGNGSCFMFTLPGALIKEVSSV